MKSLLRLLSIAATASLLATACKTSEANYRAAYDKAVAGREGGMAIDSTVYGKVRREMRSSYLIADGDSLPLRTMHVSATPAVEGEKADPVASRYGIVAGQFKTLFNARSLCARLRAAGYETASIVQTAEPYYYVVATWCADGSEAAAALRRLRDDSPVAMREPLPFVLCPAGR